MKNIQIKLETNTLINSDHLSQLLSIDIKELENKVLECGGFIMSTEFILFYNKSSLDKFKQKYMNTLILMGYKFY